MSGLRRLRLFAIGVVAAMMFLPMALFPQKSQSQGLLSGIADGNTRVVDLSYAINDKLVPWPGDEKVLEAEVNSTVEKNGYFTRSFWMLEHYGTHLDAPIHFPPGKTTVDEIPAQKLLGPAVVIDVRSDAANNPDYQLGAEKVHQWEASHGNIPSGAIV